METGHDGHRERLRERYAASGLDSFAPHEVLELLLTYAIPRKNVNPLAHKLLERFGSLGAVLSAPVDALAAVDGIGPRAAALLSLFSSVSRRLEQERGTEKIRLASADAAGQHCAALLSGLRQEHFYLVCLSAKLELLGDALIAKGSLSEVTAYPRLTAEAALAMNAHTVLLCHNHPGGTLAPSKEDIEVTRRLRDMLRSLEIRLADHIIVADGSYLSLAQSGQMPPEEGATLPRAAAPSNP